VRRGKAALGGEPFIDRQLRDARRQIKLVDGVSAVMTLTAGCLAYLLVVAVVDHWVWDLGTWGRWTALVILLAGILSYALLSLLPLLVRPINPLYAARAIEEGTPSLKNSLINFLLLRARRAGVPVVVFQALESRAAHDLAAVPPESVVDRSRLIRVGYMLAAVLVVSAAYTILSPKDSLKTVARIVAPWEVIARPSLVEVTSVSPGDVQLFQGETLQVSAEVRGSADEVRLVYSTRDGQIFGRAVPMRPRAGGLRHEATLPPAEAGGIQQDLVYRVEAGDAVTRDFEVRVSLAPHIQVEKLDYVFPAYTELPPLTVTGEGDLKGVEGTRVTIHATANQPIGAAHLEVLAGEEANPESWKQLPMESSDTHAVGALRLELAEGQRAPRQRAYRVRFVTPEGHRSQNPVVYQIEVIPDLAPEIAILSPRRAQIEVPLNGSQTIEIRALDPDFGLRGVSLHAIAGGQEVLAEHLFDDSRGRLGQQIVTYEFQPRVLGLKAGDKVVYWAVAEDNRWQIDGGTPEPNRVRTPQYELLVTPPERIPAAEAQRGDGRGGEQREQRPAEQSSPQQGAGGGAGGAGSSASEPTAGAQPGEPQQGQSGQPTGTPAGSSTGDAKDNQDGQTPETTEPPGGGAAASGKSASGEGASSERGSERGSELADRSEPLHDGEVMERILKRLEQQPGQDSPTDTTGQRGESAGRTGSASADENGDRTGSDRQPPAGSSPPSEGRSGSPRTPDSTAPTSNDVPGVAPPPGARAPQADTGQRPAGSSADQPGGAAGDGRPPADSSPSSASDAPRPPRTKTPSGDASPPPSEPDTGTSVTGRESDSQGDSGGDQRGGGQQGAGQNAAQPGRDSPGSQTPSDEGAGAAREAGAGQNSRDPGNDQVSSQPTGRPGEQGGPGSASRPESGTAPAGADSENAAGGSRPSGSSAGSQPAQGAGTPTGGGVPGDDASTAAAPATGEVPDGDAAKLEYARRATDLVLDYLRHESRAGDAKLLEELGWSAEDRQRFVDRWLRLQQAAGESASGKRELDESLRSLGLRAPQDRVREGAATSDALEGLREGTPSAPPPAAYRDQFEAFRRARARLSE
jgi:hypothetical protein